MLKDIKWPISRQYRSGSNSEPIEFYLNALTQSNTLDLLLGYFSFAAINVLSLGFARFLYNGGKLRVVANHILSSDDKEVILKANEPGNLEGNLIDLTNISGLKYTLDRYGKHFFECLAWLIKEGRIELVIIKPRGRKGIAHYKSGVFSDGVKSLKFKASCNFTAYGLLENLEEVDIDLGWEDPKGNERVQSQNEYFTEVFNGEADFVEYLPAEKIEVAIRDQFGEKDIQELLIEETELLRMKAESSNSRSLQKVIKAFEEEIEKISLTPRFPYQSGPREYQVQAYENWVKNGKQGIFAMATGTGKTLTSLNCLLAEYDESGSYKAVIVVPTIALVGQWKKECQKFNFRNIITVSSKEKWEDKLSFFNSASRFIDTSFIIIITYSSFHRSRFQNHFKTLADDTLFIADEAHNLGAGKVSKTLKNIHLDKRIGLSATIDRKYDDEGNQIIQNFFNDKPPYVISYTMKMALDVGWLCQYRYIPHVAELDGVELEEYIELSKQLMRHFDSTTGNYRNSPEVEMLLLRRKRIIHKAKNKLPVFRSILKDEFKRKGNLKYTLIYVPEGKDPEFDVQDEIEGDDEDARLINSYTRAVSDVDFSVMVKQYTSSVSNRDKILEDFESGEIHALTSMKCLDEGVDVPRSELAIFCASTGNPRQFIQRRGRVLRLHKDKMLATIHDLVVIPRIEHSSAQFNMERAIVRKELERVIDFSSLAINKIDTYEVLENVLDYYALNLNEISNIKKT